MENFQLQLLLCLLPLHIIHLLRQVHLFPLSLKDHPTSIREDALRLGPQLHDLPVTLLELVGQTHHLLTHVENDLSIIVGMLLADGAVDPILWCHCPPGAALRLGFLALSPVLLCGQSQALLRPPHLCFHQHLTLVNARAGTAVVSRRPHGQAGEPGNLCVQLLALLLIHHPNSPLLLQLLPQRQDLLKGGNVHTSPVRRLLVLLLLVPVLLDLGCQGGHLARVQAVALLQDKQLLPEVSHLLLVPHQQLPHVVVLVPDHADTNHFGPGGKLKSVVCLLCLAASGGDSAYHAGPGSAARQAGGQQPRELRVPEGDVHRVGVSELGDDGTQGQQGLVDVAALS
mmetsp:Transcript_12532/g.35205  ORF Transcript_12532/g.35205 Transcript_12532/m.35205 type:complete len:342 (+) Transcript_12532:1086-2111(+)